MHICPPAYTNGALGADPARKGYGHTASLLAQSVTCKTLTPKALDEHSTMAENRHAKLARISRRCSSHYPRPWMSDRSWRRHLLCQCHSIRATVGHGRLGLVWSLTPRVQMFKNRLCSPTASPWANIDGYFGPHLVPCVCRTIPRLPDPWLGF